MQGRTLGLALTMTALASLTVAAQVRIHVAVPGIRVNIAPPRIRIETPPVAPSLNHRWIPGYWAWRHRTHVWIGGYWTLSPRPGLSWAPARWVRAGRRWVYFEGYWQDGSPSEATQAYEPPPPATSELEDAEIEPPPPIHEVHRDIPFAGAVWINGDWHWDGHRHMWIAGRWSAPRPGHVWVAGRWVTGPHGRWRPVPGHWRR